MKLRYNLELTFDDNKDWHTVNSEIFRLIEKAYLNSDINFEITRLTQSSHSLQTYYKLEE